MSDRGRRSRFARLFFRIQRSLNAPLKENYCPDDFQAVMIFKQRMLGLLSTLENAIAIFLSTLGEEEAERGASACTRREWVSSRLPLNCPRTRATWRIRDRYVEQFFFLCLSLIPLHCFSTFSAWSIHNWSTTRSQADDPVRLIIDITLYTLQF